MKKTMLFAIVVMAVSACREESASVGGFVLGAANFLLAILILVVSWCLLGALSVFCLDRECRRQLIQAFKKKKK